MFRRFELQPSTQQIKAVFLGQRTDALVIERQAYRLRDDHTDELVQLAHGRHYWLAGRLGDRVMVWAFHDQDAADDAFDARLSTEQGWREALPNRVENLPAA